MMVHAIFTITAVAWFCLLGVSVDQLSKTYEVD